ncbi:hypothetical protein AC1031_015530 [Aphanomyces cochlioides]|nr:hypothetical protein AC1031_015530 [Aphanomyces cochlioides]
MMNTTLRCCLAALMYVALALHMTMMLPKQQQQEESLTNSEPRWTEEDVEDEDSTAMNEEHSIFSDVATTGEDLEDDLMSIDSSSTVEDNEDSDADTVIIDADDSLIFSDTATTVEDLEDDLMSIEPSSSIEDNLNSDTDMNVMDDEEWSDVATTGEDIASSILPQRHEDAAPSVDSEGYFADETEDDFSLEEPYFCLQSRTLFSRVLNELKTHKPDVDCRARVAGHHGLVLQEQTYRQEDATPHVDVVRSTGQDIASSILPQRHEDAAPSVDSEGYFADETEDDFSLEEPYFCLQSRTLFSRVLNELKTHKPDVDCRARVAGHHGLVLQEQTYRQEDATPHVDVVRSTGQDIASSILPQRHEDAAPSVDSEGYFADETEDDFSLEEPYFCLQSRTLFSRVLNELKTHKPDVDCRARVAGHHGLVLQEQTYRQEDATPHVDVVRSTGQDIASSILPQRHEDAAPSVDSEGYFADETEDDFSLEEPYFCLQSRTLFSRVLNELKTHKPDVDCRARVAGHHGLVLQEQTYRQEDAIPHQFWLPQPFFVTSRSRPGDADRLWHVHPAKLGETRRSPSDAHQRWLPQPFFVTSRSRPGDADRLWHVHPAKLGETRRSPSDAGELCHVHVAKFCAKRRIHGDAHQLWLPQPFFVTSRSRPGDADRLWHVHPAKLGETRRSPSDAGELCHVHVAKFCAKRRIHGDAHRL